MGGMHIDVITLERNAYFFENCRTCHLKPWGYSRAQHRLLRSTLVWKATYMDFHTKLFVFDMIWQLRERKLLFYIWGLTISKTSDNVKWEGCTSMSPRSNETRTLFEKCRTSHLKPLGFSRMRRTDPSDLPWYGKQNVLISQAKLVLSKWSSSFEREKWCFTYEVWRFLKQMTILDGRDAHRCHHARTKRVLCW